MCQDMDKRSLQYWMMFGVASPQIRAYRAGKQKNLQAWSRSVRLASERASQRLLDFETLARQIDDLAAMDFSFLFDTDRRLFSIGFNIAEGRRDPGFYDLLASEARLCSYVAIATGQVPQEHWFALNRVAHRVIGGSGFGFVGGSMFEYLMPLLVMPNYENTLLDYTCSSVVRLQIGLRKKLRGALGHFRIGLQSDRRGLELSDPGLWVPGLGLKRGLADDLVISPYASALALAVAPRAACDNMQRLAREGLEGTYGFYEAVDFTSSRLPPNETRAVIRSFMAHHQGMSLVALDNVLREYPMWRRFMACPLLKACWLLLQERVPRAAASVFTGDLEQENSRHPPFETDAVMRVFTNPSLPVPEVHLLSNGRYHVVVTTSGGGYSRWRDLAVTRWREDATRDCWGMFVYLRDVTIGNVWSAAYQPTLRATKGYEAIFTQARAEFRQSHLNLEMHTEISVSPEDDVELRRLTITNRSSVWRTIELTSYAEVVLAPPAADAAHPAFSNLFVQTEFDAKNAAILCLRRRRSEEECSPWLLHLMVGKGVALEEASCETDRSKFIGRHGTAANPVAMHRPGPLSNTVGSVLDPIISLRRKVTIPPHETAVVDLIVGVTETHEDALALVDKYQSSRMSDRALDLAWTHSQVMLRHFNATEAEAQLYGRLAGALVSRPGTTGQPRGVARQPPQPERIVELWHLRRHTDSAAADWRPGEA